VAASATPKPSPSAVLNFANWPLYIDTDAKVNTKHKTLEDFTAKYGTKVDYKEVINDNESFFGTIKPVLDQVPPDIFSDDPRGADCPRVARLPLPEARQEGPRACGRAG